MVRVVSYNHIVRLEPIIHHALIRTAFSVILIIVLLN